MPESEGAAIEVVAGSGLPRVALRIDEGAYSSEADYGVVALVTPGTHAVRVRAHIDGRPGGYKRLPLPEVVVESTTASVEVAEGEIVSLGVDLSHFQSISNLHVEGRRRFDPDLRAKADRLGVVYLGPVTRWHADFDPPTGLPVANLTELAKAGTAPLDDFDEVHSGLPILPAVPEDGSGWFPDPSGRHHHRWYDGQNWSVFVEDDHHNDVDPLG